MNPIFTATGESTTTTVPPEVQIVPPSRPISDWLVDVFNLDPDGSAAGFLSWIAEPLFQIIATIFIAWVILRVVRHVAGRILRRTKLAVTAKQSGLRGSGVAGRRIQRMDAHSAVLNSVLGVVVWGSALLLILVNTFGVNLAPVIFSAGIIGVALAFGAQDLIRDFLAGFFMLVEDQYAVGDVIDVGDATGTVEKVSLRTTRLRSVNGTVWHFPNGEIRRVGNLSQEWSRALLDIEIAYDSDIDQATQVIESVADEMASESRYENLFLASPEVWGVEGLTADAILLRLVIKTVPGEQWPISRELRRRIKLAFDTAGIEIPFPQRTVWLRRDP